MKLPSLLSAALFASGLAACVHGASISQAKAIDLGVDACRRGWGKADRNWEASYPSHEWEARQKGDHWFVWFGEEYGPKFSVKVPNEGGPLDPKTSCLALIED